VVRVSLQQSTQEKSMLQFSVIDTGPGIPKEKLQHVFKSFTQADGSSTRKHGGTGLGLTISSQLVKLMNGRMWVESKVGKGSTFQFSAQFGLQRRTKKSNIEEAAQNRHHVRRAIEDVKEEIYNILLVEDNIINQKVAIHILEKKGHHVDVSNNGLEALDAIERNKYDVILMDIQMPSMGGFETTSIIREKEKQTCRHMPIIAMTAHAMKGDRELCLEAGMDDYVSKPINQNSLFEAIRRQVSVSVDTCEIEDSREINISSEEGKGSFDKKVDNQEPSDKEKIVT